ncbi:DUF1758 domain-containing protein [Trichonephila inaurata madagascariensis]|uniref:DUF1758 domain-containing protein n=1 Tax=Trichonephila inaurata madagascariensis TaxID=2747483 RepID=A0A8X6X4Z1_9ARAC|nr:DUF1758 domain-containing protein [Trichonephila inaurata madagascariensis]
MLEAILVAIDTQLGPPVVNSNFEVENQGSSQSSVSAQTAEMKLSTLSLPTFSGVTEEWLAFSDLFETAVSNNQNVKTCKSKFRCKKCKTPRHSLLHIEIVSSRGKQGAVNVLNSSRLSVNASVFSPAPIPGTSEPSENSKLWMLYRVLLMCDPKYTNSSLNSSNVGKRYLG